MNIDHLQYQYKYHFHLNRTFWDYCVENLTWEQFLQETGISVNTIRNQFVHLMDVEERWFNGFKGTPNPGSVDSTLFDILGIIREKWDKVESEIKRILEGFTDEYLEKTYHQDMKVWHVLAHVVNHATAHRAQIGAMLRSLGLMPPPQDFIFFVMGRL